MSTGESPAIPETVRVQLASGHVEEMPLDEYVKGVAPNYLGSPAPQEALKALAIALRSEAAASRRHSRDGFDLCNGPHCFVWRPTSRYPDADLAVDETAGLVLTAGGIVVTAPFFESCDGHTRSSAEVWSSPMSHCQSVSCACGVGRLQGHGVGLCQRGATAMAGQGVTGVQILQHYFSRADVSAVRAVPRGQMRQSLIAGRVVDAGGRPLPGLRLALSGEAGAIHKAAGSDGRFWFGGLAAGVWELAVKGKWVRCAGLVTDGRSAVDVEVVVPEGKYFRAQVVPLAHPKQLIGTLGYPGIPVTLVDAAGNESTVLSGSAREFDPGGFVLPLPAPGNCALRFLDQRLDLEIGSGGVWVRFSQDSEAASAGSE